MHSRTRPSAKEMETSPQKTLSQVRTHRHVHTHTLTHSKAGQGHYCLADYFKHSWLRKKAKEA